MMRFILAITLLLAVIPAEAANEIGSVSRAQGHCTGAIDGQTRTLAAGMPVFLQELVETGEDARLELLFDDGTVLTMGEKASVKVDDFVYRPGGIGSDIGAAIVGPFRFVSSKLAKSGTGSKTVETPFATIVIRGTDFFGGPIDGQFGVLLLEGAVDVVAAGATAELRNPGEGINIAAPGAPPGPVTIWPQDKVSRALSSVTFQ